MSRSDFEVHRDAEPLPEAATTRVPDPPPASRRHGSVYDRPEQAMALSAFEDPSQPPSPDALRQALGPSADLWFALLRQVRSACPPLSELWHHSGARFGWSLRLKQRERVILYVTPQHGAFLVGLVLGERAAGIAEAGSLPPLALAALAAAPRYAEGRGLRVSVSSPEGLEAVLALIPFKLLPPGRPVSRSSVSRRGRA
jgi:hypothetical protein